MISHHCREISHWLPLAQTKKKKRQSSDEKVENGSTTVHDCKLSWSRNRPEKVPETAELEEKCTL